MRASGKPTLLQWALEPELPDPPKGASGKIACTSALLRHAATAAVLKNTAKLWVVFAAPISRQRG